MATDFWFGGGKDIKLSDSRIRELKNSYEFESYIAALKAQARPKMCQSKSASRGQFINQPQFEYIEDYSVEAPSWYNMGNWQLHRTGNVTWSGTSDGNGGYNYSAKLRVTGQIMKTYTFLYSDGGNPLNFFTTYVLPISIPANPVFGGGDYLIIGNFDIKEDYELQCPCKKK